MKPFDLEAAKSGAAVCTQNGKSVRIVAFDRLDSIYPIIALIKYDVGESVTCFTAGGKLVDNNDKSGLDLVMYEPEPVKHEYWVNVYKDSDERAYLYVSSPLHKTEEAAKAHASLSVVATVRIEWTE